MIRVNDFFFSKRYSNINQNLLIRSFLLHLLGHGLNTALKPLKFGVFAYVINFKNRSFRTFSSGQFGFICWKLPQIKHLFHLFCSKILSLLCFVFITPVAFIVRISFITQFFLKPRFFGSLIKRGLRISQFFCYAPLIASYSSRLVASLNGSV